MNKEFEKRSKEVFEVLSILVKIDKGIIFLGGSAIQATLPEQKRLSIDLDISYSDETDKLIHGLENAGYTVVKRKSRNPIFVFYTVTNKDVMVKLDITRLTITETEKRHIKDFEVLLPTQRYFLASKLSSLAFGTIGRLAEEQSQIMKDIFDINCLLDNKPSLKEMKEDWHKIISDQNRLRNTNHKEVQCAEDVQKTLLKCVEAVPSDTMWRVPSTSVDRVNPHLNFLDGTEAPLSVGSSHRVTPSFFITPNSLGSFQDTLVKGKVLRQDLATMSARALLLLVNMDNDFYEVDKQVLSDATSPKKLEEAEKTLLTKQILKADQLRALKIIAPRALLYLFYWIGKKRGDNSVTTNTEGAHNPRYS